jgi:hypothetical protein
VFRSNVNGTPGSEVLQAAPEMESPTVVIFVVPPVPNPFASDIVNNSCCPLGKGTATENDPCAVSGMEKFRGVPKTYGKI